jgi:hypothetical protein
LKYTNKYGVPESVVRAIKNDSYDKGQADFSVTGLLKPARAARLEELHKHELEEDVSDRIFSLLGQSVHSVLERSARPDSDLVEKRFFTKIEGVVLSGQIDLLERDTNTLSDFKVTKAYPFTSKGGKGQKPEWIQQLNMQLELIRSNGYDATKLQIVGIIRDWDKRCTDPYQKLKYMAGYPEAEIAVVEMPIWDRDKTESFIKSRIEAHVKAKDALPLCTPAETWGGNRCKGYCTAAPFCTQFQESKKTGLIQTQEKV